MLCRIVPLSLTLVTLVTLLGVVILVTPVILVTLLGVVETVEFFEIPSVVVALGSTGAGDPHRAHGSSYCPGG